jgi:hypothetical protein
MATEENPRPQDDLKAGPVVLVGIVSVILTFVAIVAISVLFLRGQEAETYNKSKSVAPDELRRLRNDQLLTLAEYRWVDQKKGIVRIPIDRAMEIMVREAAEKSGSRGGD